MFFVYACGICFLAFFAVLIITGRLACQYGYNCAFLWISLSVALGMYVTMTVKRGWSCGFIYTMIFF